LALSFSSFDGIGVRPVGSQISAARATNFRHSEQKATMDFQHFKHAPQTKEAIGPIATMN